MEAGCEIANWLQYQQIDYCSRGIRRRRCDSANEEKELFL
jgi:hypothetical protein